VIGPSADDFDARVADLERFLDELDRRNWSNFTVTNPTSGVKNLEVGPVGSKYQIVLRDSNDNVIFGNHLNPDIGFSGFRMPMPMYPSIPYAGGVTATTTTWVTMWQTRTFVNSHDIQASYRYGDTAPAGGTTEARLQYDIGAGPVTVASSVASSVNPTNTPKAFTFTWPSDVFDTEVTLLLQARMVTGTGAAVASPMYVVGG
jgi:hypothetical protein